MNDAERRNMWADRIERRLASNTASKQWCQLNRVAHHRPINGWHGSAKKSQVAPSAQQRYEELNIARALT